ncbi:hypothetical protein Q0Z83_033400 [Actinoplanes sichuanensis]|nr:hypothetical protein Q0Z83_033400 [Actinoplanes sichuanensis]
MRDGRAFDGVIDGRGDSEGDGGGSVSASPNLISVYRRFTSMATGGSSVSAGATPSRTPNQDTVTAVTVTASHPATYLQLRLIGTFCITDTLAQCPRCW